jgi:hypothetical protein
MCASPPTRRQSALLPARRDFCASSKAYLGDIPDEWTAEYEAELPERLQDWTKVVGGGY